MLGDRGCNRVDAIGMVVAFFLLACLLLPALAQSNSNADRSLCLRRMMDISKWLIAYEQTTGSFPVSSTQPFENRPGSVDKESAAGYSWLVRLTPFMDARARFWDGLIWHSKKLTVPPYAPELKTIVNDKEIHPAVHSFPEFLCPSYAGDKQVTKADSDYPEIAGQMPAVGNYHAFAGSHFINSEGFGEFPPVVVDNRVPFTGDGAIPFLGEDGKYPSHHGVRAGNNFVDAAAHTFLFAESLEPTYSALIDGQSMWFVAAWPGNKIVPSMRPDQSVRGHSVIGWDASDKKDVKASIGLRQPDGSTVTYLSAERWSGTHDRRWGPSSNHPGVVGHAFADGRVITLAMDVDPEIYLHLATRSGREIVPNAIMNDLIQGKSTRDPR